MSERVNLPESADAFLEELGLPSARAPSAPSAALDSIRGKIAADLEQTQGPHRRRSALARHWPTGLALLAGVGILLLIRPDAQATPLMAVTTVFAAVAGLLCLVAVAIAPDRPSLGERLSLGGVLMSLSALGLEGVVAAGMPETAFEGGLKCAGVMIGAGLVPIAFTTLALKRSGLPARRLHAAALILAGFALSGAAVWLHCPTRNLWHILTGHMALPTVAVVVLSLVVHALLNRRARVEL